MKTALIVFFVFLGLFLVACGAKEVVPAGETAEEKDGEAMEESSETVDDVGDVMEDKPATTVTTKVAVDCDDSDGNDEFSSGIVSVTYEDGSTEDFIDECPVPNEQFLTEYVCENDNVKSKIFICDSFCVAGVCFT